MKYAESTSVPTDRSRAEIEKILQRYGATGFLYGWNPKEAVIGFQMAGRQVKILLPLPDKNDPKFQITPERRYRRSPEAALSAWEQACRQKWRALALLVKAKLEAIESGIETFDEAFMPHIVLPHGQTVAEFMTPQIEVAYETGAMPALLPQLEAQK